MYNTTKPYIKQILELIKKTQKGNELPSHIDGIGTKGVYHWEKRTFKNAVIDSLAMNLNDFAVMRVKALQLQDHIILPKDDSQAIYEIIEALAEECKKRNIAISGGETSIHENFPGLEISTSLQGKYINKKENIFGVGDYLIGIESNGLHANGFTKVRELFGDEIREEFVKPTFIYYDTLLDIFESGLEIHGMVHVTGGAFMRLKKAMKETDAVIEKNNSLIPQNIFYEIYNQGVSDEEMYKTFNCGIGFIFGVSEKSVKEIISCFIAHGFKTDVIGKVFEGNGEIKIKSSFSDREIILK